jgi:LPXTG-motif cell wall-anchored protein
LPIKIYAKTDLSITDADLTFSKNEPFKNDPIRIYARVFNSGDTDVIGYIVFSANNKEINKPQPISIKTDTYDDVFIDWISEPGKYNITAKIVGTEPNDENSGNDQAVKIDFFVDTDIDGDGIGDSQDEDIDGDGVLNEEEVAMGTSPTNPDTDGDDINDNIDAFPLDKTEWRDTDNNGIGDNKDPDVDGDGIPNEEEIKIYGTNPTNPDTDGDGVQDKKELDNKTNPNKADTDNDGVDDFKDAYPLDSSKWSASIFDSIRSFVKDTEYGVYVFIGIPALIVLFFLFFKKKKRKRRNSE